MNRKNDQKKNLRCAARKKDGNPCSVAVKERDKLCFFHDPAKAQEFRASQVLGGKGNRAPSLPIDLPDFAPETVSDLCPFIVATINQVRRGELNSNAATAICNLINCLIKAMDDRELRQRLHDLEQLLLEAKNRRGLFDPDAERME